MGFFVWFVCADVQMQAGSTEAWQLAAALGGSLRSTALAQQRSLSLGMVVLCEPGF